MSAPAAGQRPDHQSPSDASPPDPPPPPHPPSDSQPSPSATNTAPHEPSKPSSPQQPSRDANIAPDTSTHPEAAPLPKQSEADGMDQVQLQQVKTEGVEPTLDHVNGTIQLVEHTPDTIAIEEAVGVACEEAGEWVQEGDQMKRVKVYELIGSRWVDQGTAFCFGQFQEETGEALLIARAERDFNDVILRTVIRSNDVYQRQQDTLIVWTEPDGVDYALSFQDPEGCSEVWNFITEVQQHMNNIEDSNGLSSSPILGSDTSITTASIIRSGHLPAPQLGIIGEVERAIKALSRTQAIKERICEYIQHEEYIKSLIEVLNTAEDLESLENLHALCSLMQTILMLNDHTLYEHILEDDLFYGVVGMLEYDPDFPSHKANYRDFLQQATHFHQPIPIQDPVVQRKIHHTYRLQFLKDVVLARALDDSTFNVLNSCIIFNQIDIISHIQQDQMFLKEIVRLFVDEEVLTGGAQRYQMQMQIIQQQQMQQRLQGPVVISLPSADQEEGPVGGGGGRAGVEGESVKEEEGMEVDGAARSTVLTLSTPANLTRPMNGMINGRTGTPNTTTNSRPGAYSFAPPDDLSEEEINHRREVVLLIQQLCIMGKNVQLPARMTLFRILVDRGILFAVQWAIGLPESVEINRQMISAAGEVLAALLDHDLNGVRGHVLKQVMAIEKERAVGKTGADKAETLLEMACRMMARSRDLAVQCLIGDALKVWMDTPSGDTPGGLGEASHAVAAPKIPARKDDAGTERFLEYFYKECVHILFKPLLELQEWKSCTETVLTSTREQSNRYVYLCDLLYNFIQQHHFRSNFYVLSANNILSRVATLLRAKDKHLRHASFRIFRLLLRQNNAHIHGLVMKHDVLKPILDLTLQESRRDNLLSCSCQEYFESMRRDNMKELIKFCMTKHEEDIRKLAETPLGGQRFELLIRRYEMNNEPLPKESEPERPVDTRLRPGQGRFLDAEEEDYFNADDDEDDGVLPSISQQSQWARAGVTVGVLSPGKIINVNPNINSLKRKRRGEVTGRGHRPPLRTPSLKSLVDYGEDEDEESSSATGQKLTSDKTSSPKLTLGGLIPAPSGAGIGPPPKRMVKEEEDEEDSLLEALVRGKTPTPRPESPMPSLSPPQLATRLGEKRRRGDDDDDDDELLSRLTKFKKQQVGGHPQQQQQQVQQHQHPQQHHQPQVQLRDQQAKLIGEPPSNPLTGIGNRQKNGDDPPKKIKLKIGGFGNTLASAAVINPPVAAGLSNTLTTKGETTSTPPSTASTPSPSHSPAPSASPSPAPSDSGTKDGDTG